VRAWAIKGAAGLVALGALVMMPSPHDFAAASCAAPLIQFADGRSLPLISPGETLTLTGEGFVRGCDDGSEEGFGCAPPPYEQPRKDVNLSLVRGAEEQLLETADARNDGDHLGRISWTVTIPADAEDGRATLVPDGGEPLPVRIADR
jgi:hypothetical protein